MHCFQAIGFKHQPARPHSPYDEDVPEIVSGVRLGCRRRRSACSGRSSPTAVAPGRRQGSARPPPVAAARTPAAAPLRHRTAPTAPRTAQDRRSAVPPRHRTSPPPAQTAAGPSHGRSHSRSKVALTGRLLARRHGAQLPFHGAQLRALPSPRLAHLPAGPQSSSEADAGGGKCW